MKQFYHRGKGEVIFIDSEDDYRFLTDDYMLSLPIYAYCSPDEPIGWLEGYEEIGQVLAANNDWVSMKTELWFEFKPERRRIFLVKREEAPKEEGQLYTVDDMMDIAGWMAAADNKRPIPELKEEAEHYIETLNAKKKFIPNKEQEAVEGELITYCGFSHSNRNHLTIEVCGEENYIGNNFKKGDKFRITKL